MNKFPFLWAIPLCFGVFCTHPQAAPLATAFQDSLVNPTDSLLLHRFVPPPGFSRQAVDSTSFSHFLRHLPLKPKGSKVRYFNGEEKADRGVYDAVVDLPIGRKDLHQCADAVMRLRAEYLWNNRQYEQIQFRFTNGFLAKYDRWRKGERIKVVGNRAYWVNNAAPSDTYATFWAYLEMVFSYAGTLSLAKELQPKSLADLEAGDVFIRGGAPGHAVIIVEVATTDSGRKVFLLAQSYMPAQELQILKNPTDPGLSPWYSTDFKDILYTPEWSFRKDELKGF